MAQVYTDIGLYYLLQIMLKNVAQTDILLRLYTNSHTPVAGDLVSDYTEPTDVGYNAITLVPGDWTFGLHLSVATALQPVQTFTFAGPGPTTVEGYWLSDVASSVVLWAEVASSPITLGAGTVDVAIQAKIKNC